jgi:hypothetical protein
VNDGRSHPVAIAPTPQALCGSRKIQLGDRDHPKAVSERLGHSTVAFTMDVYSAVIPSLGRAMLAELLIDCEEDRTLRSVLVGMMQEGRQGSSQ